MFSSQNQTYGKRWPSVCLPGSYTTPWDFIPSSYTTPWGSIGSRKVAKEVQKLAGIKWMVSYDDVPTIRNLYQNVRSVGYTLSYSAKGRYKGSEVMFFSKGLEVPSLPPNTYNQLLAS
jgi:hypothetical protein